MSCEDSMKDQFSKSKVAVLGATGLVGSAIIRALIDRKYVNIVGTYYTKDPFSTFSEYKKYIEAEKLRFVKIDLTNQVETARFFEKEKPDYVYLAAAKVGGIWANNVYRADFIYKNLQIECNVIHQSYLYGVKKLLFLGSTCIYPRSCPQPIKEEYLLTGELEYTNEPHAIAKIAGMKMCESYNIQHGTNFISVMPTNLYGYNDNFDLETSHVLPALLRKMHLAKALRERNWDAVWKDLKKRPVGGVSGDEPEGRILEVLSAFGVKADRALRDVCVEVWGTGAPKREFLWADDLADACVYIMENVDFVDIVKLVLGIEVEEPLIEYIKKGGVLRNIHVNIGTGEEVSIKELAYLVRNVVGFGGRIVFDTSKPDGTPRKVTDVERLHFLGWRHRISLEEGLRRLYRWYLEDLSHVG